MNSLLIYVNNSYFFEDSDKVSNSKSLNTFIKSYPNLSHLNHYDLISAYKFKERHYFFDVNRWVSRFQHPCEVCGKMGRVFLYPIENKFNVFCPTCSSNSNHFKKKSFDIDFDEILVYGLNDEAEEKKILSFLKSGIAFKIVENVVVKDDNNNEKKT